MSRDIRSLNWDCLKTVQDPLDLDDLESELTRLGVHIMHIRGYASKTNISIIGDNSAKDFRRMAEAAGIRGAFVEEMEVLPEDVRISRYDEGAFDEVTIRAVRERIDEYNAVAERTISRCREVKVVFAVVGDVPIGIIMADEKVAGLLAKEPHQTLEDIVEWESRKVEEAQAEEGERLSALGRELKVIILDDPRFKSCGNKNERKEYARKIWYDPDFARFRALFRQPSGRELLGNCQAFVEDVYKESIGDGGGVWVLGQRVR